MTTILAFHEMMGQFLGELANVFPEEPAIQAALTAPRDRATFDEFMKNMRNWSTQMMQKSDSFWVEENAFVKGLNMHVIWKTDACTPNTKAATWQYLQSLYMIGTTMSMFPPETLAMIESAAENCAKNMQQGGGAIDENALNGMLAQMLGGGGGGNPLAALMGGISRPQEPKKNRSSKKKTSR
jgi:hypothetical protein